MGAAGCPGRMPFGLSMCAPVLFRFGMEAQKQKYLPRICNGDDFWCQGYSEPRICLRLGLAQNRHGVPG